MGLQGSEPGNQTINHLERTNYFYQVFKFAKFGRLLYRFNGYLPKQCEWNFDMYFKIHFTYYISYTFSIKNNYFLNKKLDLLRRKKIIFDIALRPILN